MLFITYGNKLLLTKTCINKLLCIFSDVVAAYKGLVKEKEALEISLKALTKTEGNVEGSFNFLVHLFTQCDPNVNIMFYTNIYLLSTNNNIII